MSGGDPIFLVSVRSAGSTEFVDVPEDRLLSLSFEDVETKADKLSLTVDNYDLTQFGPMWQPGNLVRFMFGEHGRMSPAREMSIVRVRGFNPLTIEAHGGELLFSLRPRPDRRWERVRHSDVARDLAREAGFLDERVDVVETKVVHAEITQGPLNDYQFLNSLAAREGFWFYIDHAGFHFRPRDKKQPPARRFVYFTDPGRGDILSISIDDNRSPGKPGAVSVGHRDPLTKATTIETVTAYDEPSLSSETAVVAPAPNSLGKEFVFSSSATTGPEALTAAKSLAVAQQEKGLMITMTARGDASVLAKSVVEIDGIGPYLSGLYYVVSVKHDLDGGSGYKMTLKARSEGPKRAMTDGGALLPTTKPVEGVVNKETAADAPSPGEVGTGSTPMKEVQVRDTANGVWITKLVPR
jgi:hypothetical protein